MNAASTRMEINGGMAALLGSGPLDLVLGSKMLSGEADALSLELGDANLGRIPPGQEHALDPGVGGHAALLEGERISCHGDDLASMPVISGSSRACASV
jgi:uncharacterized Zn-binding protein involved in type VI secretion